MVSEPRCTGWVKAWATGRNWRSKKAQEKSARVLMLVEYALRRRAMAISSVASSRALRMTSNWMGSVWSGMASRG